MGTCKWSDKVIDKIEDNLVSHTCFYKRGVDRKYIPNALEKIGGRIERISDFPTTKKLDEDKLLTNIDDVIKYLKSLKDEGYMFLDDDYEYGDRFFIAKKYGVEDSEHYYKRLAEMISPFITEMRKNDDEKERKKARIKELEMELAELKKG